MADPRGFEEYVAARRDTLVRAAFLLTGDIHVAEDVVQNTLVRIWPRWKRISAADDVDAYVRRVLTSVFLTSARRRRWRELLSGPAGDPRQEPAAADGAWLVETRMELRDWLRTLPPRQRAVLVLRYFLDLSEAEAARELGCSVGTVKSQSARAITRLRAEVAGAAAIQQERGDVR